MLSSDSGPETNAYGANQPYGESFFSNIQDGSLRSAQAILPLVFDLARPATLIDVGCGTGAWLKAAAQLGVSEVLGVDGEWVDADELLIAPDQFVALDLCRSFKFERGFDLAICMEVAEHLEASRADSFVDDLCALADVVLFSAAVPGQTGTDHRNEQWPPYWRRRFRSNGYGLVDCLRARLWADRRIEPWYAQNALLYVRFERLESDQRLRDAATENGRMSLEALHPRLFAVFSPPSVPADPEPTEAVHAPTRFETQH